MKITFGNRWHALGLSISLFAFPLTVSAIPATAPILEAGSDQQSHAIKGTVLDKTSREPLIGVTVTVKGTTTGTVTDIDGNYTINAPKGSTLVFSYVGYSQFETKAADNLEVLLAEDAQALEEVVVVGYGVQKKASVTGSVSTVKGSELKTTGVANVTNTFAGKLPGVVANNRTGEPGNDYSDIFIRGKGTLNNNSPLIIIDGVANREGLERLNPNDIESINVLKDASAAIYGAQAANGVILVPQSVATAGNRQSPTTVHSLFLKTPALQIS